MTYYFKEPKGYLFYKLTATELTLIGYQTMIIVTSQPIKYFIEKCSKEGVLPCTEDEFNLILAGVNVD